MNRRLLSLLAAPALLLSTAAMAQPEYVSIEMEIDVDRSAEEAWSKMGDYCDISEWLNLDCVITSGDGGIGTMFDPAGRAQAPHQPLGNDGAQGGGEQKRLDPHVAQPCDGAGSIVGVYR